jgi:hypothetical protein
MKAAKASAFVSPEPEKGLKNGCLDLPNPSCQEISKVDKTSVSASH